MFLGVGLISQGRLLGHYFPLKLYRLSLVYKAPPPSSATPIATALRLSKNNEKYKLESACIQKPLAQPRTQGSLFEPGYEVSHRLADKTIVFSEHEVFKEVVMVTR